MNKKKISKVIGNFLTIASILGIIFLILKLDINLSIFLNFKLIAMIVVLGVILSSAVLLNSIAWRALLCILTNKEIKLKDILNIYSKSNINKYLPGNIMHYATRNLLGAQYEIDQKSIFAATIFEIILKILCASMIVIVFVRKELIKALDNISIQPTALVILLTVIILVILISLWVLSKTRNINLRISIKYIIKANLMYIIVFMLNIIVFVVISMIISPDKLNANDIQLTSGIYLIAWLIGYLTPGSPGGLGIRESLMILLLGSTYDYDTVIAISIGVRLVTIFADLFSYALNLIYEKRESNEINNTNTLL